MHIKQRILLGLAALTICFHGHAVDAQAANNGSNPGISQKTAPCDWNYPTRCLKVNADGSINTSGAAGGGVFTGAAGAILPPGAEASAPISVSTATTTQIVALSASKKIYVTSFDVVAAGTGNITFVYGTGANCGTGTTSLTGAYNLVAQAGIAKGNGLGAVLVVPASNALCVTTSAAVQMSGSVSYAQY